ncbi:uncharacterized protein LOC126896538 isoform X2 [Daktulosphaira vitifoliae]|uniref:uncharacterized protein LOC126896538 isoform X2 n=1 Tax=Daktulosphaira vitifoliae TaxID=58002 RepID=UPI0021AABFAB|nr:uncharacterized protein LOC126896538 isoform X2 [Daktulosphaira vitifoliae]
MKITSTLLLISLNVCLIYTKQLSNSSIPRVNNTNIEKPKDQKDIRTGDYYPSPEVSDLLRKNNIDINNVEEISSELKSKLIEGILLPVPPIGILAPGIKKSLEGDIFPPSISHFYDQSESSFLKSNVPEFSHFTSSIMSPLSYDLTPIHSSLKSTASPIFPFTSSPNMYNPLPSTPYSYMTKFQDLPESYNQFYHYQQMYAPSNGWN